MFLPIHCEIKIKQQIESNQKLIVWLCEAGREQGAHKMWLMGWFKTHLQVIARCKCISIEPIMNNEHDRVHLSYSIHIQIKRISPQFLSSSLFLPRSILLIRPRWIFANIRVNHGFMRNVNSGIRELVKSGEIFIVISIFVD